MICPYRKHKWLSTLKANAIIRLRYFAIIVKLEPKPKTIIISAYAMHWKVKPNGCDDYELAAQLTIH